MKKKRPRINGVKIVPLQKTKDHSALAPKTDPNQEGAGADHSSVENKSPDETK